MTTGTSGSTSQPGAGRPAHPAWSRWWVPVACAAATLPLIFVFGPEYLELQQAPDADNIRSIVGDDRWRYAVAAAVDFVFAASYGVAALAISKRAGLALRAPAGIVVGAVLDELENVFVLVNVLWVASIDDTTVDIMRGIGRLKNWALVVGVLLLVAGVVWLLVRRRTTR